MVLIILYKLEIQGNYLNLVKDICEYPTANDVLNKERSTPLLPRSRAWQGCLLSPCLSGIALEVLAGVISQEKLMRCRNWEEKVERTLFTMDMIIYEENPKMLNEMLIKLRQL